MSKNSPRSWTGMPFARKSKIFGLHSLRASPIEALCFFFITNYVYKQLLFSSYINIRHEKGGVYHADFDT